MMKKVNCFALGLVLGLALAFFVSVASAFEPPEEEAKQEGHMHHKLSFILLES